MSLTAAGHPGATVRPQVIGLIVAVPLLMVALPTTGGMGASVICVVSTGVSAALMLVAACKALGGGALEYARSTSADLVTLRHQLTARVRPVRKRRRPMRIHACAALKGYAPRRKPAIWQLLRLVLAGSGRQAFLDANWVQLALAATPRSHRRQVAIRILGLSPHYFVRQWTTLYSDDASRSEVLCAEARRTRETRRDLVEQLVAPYLKSEQVVLELGCGPGFMAAELAPRVRQVVGVDISRGALACARVLHNAANVTYLHGNGSRLSDVSSASIDVLTAFASIQHMDRAAIPEVFAEIAREAGSRWSRTSAYRIHGKRGIPAESSWPSRTRSLPAAGGVLQRPRDLRAGRTVRSPYRRGTPDQPMAGAG